MNIKNNNKKVPIYEGGRSRWYYLGKGLLTSFLVTIPVFIILSIALTMGEFPDKYISPAVFATTITSILCASFFSTAGSYNSGWFNGSLVGFLYMAVILIIRCMIEKKLYIDRESFTLLLSGVLLGTIGGIAGINLSLKKLLRRKKNL